MRPDCRRGSACECAWTGSTTGSLIDREDSALIVVDAQCGFIEQVSIRDSIEKLGRRTLTFVGFETDVCIAHSALGMLDRGFRACVVEDACGSPPPHHGSGISRMRDAGVVITNAKGMYLEWVRDLATHARVTRMLDAPLSPGVEC